MSGRRLGDNSGWGSVETSAQTIGRIRLGIDSRYNVGKARREVGFALWHMNQTTQLGTCLLNSASFIFSLQVRLNDVPFGWIRNKMAKKVHAQSGTTDLVLGDFRRCGHKGLLPAVLPGSGCVPYSCPHGDAQGETAFLNMRAKLGLWTNYDFFCQCRLNSALSL